MTTERRRAALHEVSHDSLLSGRWGMHTQVLCSVVTKNIGDLEIGPPLFGSHGSAQDYGFGRAEQIERTGDSLDVFGADFQVALGDRNVVMPQEDLHDSDVNAQLEQVSGKAVPEHMRRDSFSEPRDG